MSEFFGTIPIHQKIEVLSADKPAPGSKPRFKVSEQIGVGIINTRGLNGGRARASELLLCLIMPLDGVFALMRPPFAYRMAGPNERGDIMPGHEGRIYSRTGELDYSRIMEGRIERWAKTSEELEMLQWEAQTIVDQGLYQNQPPHLHILALYKKLAASQNKTLTVRDLFVFERMLLRISPERAKQIAEKLMKKLCSAPDYADPYPITIGHGTALFDC